MVRFSQGPGREAGLTMHRRYSWIFSPLPHLGVSLSNVSNDHTFVIVYSPCAGCWAAPGFPNDRRGSPFRRQHTQALFPRREGMATACRPQSGVTLPSVRVWHRHHGVVNPFALAQGGFRKTQSGPIFTRLHEDFSSLLCVYIQNDAGSPLRSSIT